MNTLQQKILLQTPLSMLRKGMAWAAKKPGAFENRNSVTGNPAVIIKEGTMESRDNSSVLQQITMLLIEADRLVKEGKLTAAFEKIRQARSQDPQHLYAIAYEERVKGLIQAREKVHGSDIHKTNNTVPEPVRTPQHRSGQLNAPVNGHPGAADVLSASNAPVRKIPAVSVDERVKVTLNETQRQFQQKKFETFLLHAQNYFHKKEYNHALDEIARIYLFDPLNKAAHALEEQVRRAIAMQSVEQKAAQSHAVVDQEKQELLTKEAADNQRRAAIAQKIGTIISRASWLIEKKEYSRALEEISRAYILDPGHAQLPVLEEIIYNAELKSWNPADAQSQSVNAPSRQREDAHSKKDVVPPEGKILHQRHKQALTQFMNRIAELLAVNQLEEALNEVASAIISDPFNERILRLERAIIEAQHKQLAERQKQCKEIVAALC